MSDPKPSRNDGSLVENRMIVKDFLRSVLHPSTAELVTAMQAYEAALQIDVRQHAACL